MGVARERDAGLLRNLQGRLKYSALVGTNPTPVASLPLLTCLRGVVAAGMLSVVVSDANYVFGVLVD